MCLMFLVWLEVVYAWVQVCLLENRMCPADDLWPPRRRGSHISMLRRARSLWTEALRQLPGAWAGPPITDRGWRGILYADPLTSPSGGSDVTPDSGNKNNKTRSERAGVCLNFITHHRWRGGDCGCPHRHIKCICSFFLCGKKGSFITPLESSASCDATPTSTGELIALKNMIQLRTSTAK